MTVTVITDASTSSASHCAAEGGRVASTWAVYVRGHKKAGRKPITQAGEVPGFARGESHLAESYAAVMGARFGRALFPSAKIVVRTDCKPALHALADDGPDWGRPFRLALRELQPVDFRKAPRCETKPAHDAANRLRKSLRSHP